MIVELSIGEVIDRLTILEIKLARISKVELRRHVVVEHEKLLASFAASQRIEGIDAIRAELKAVNESLWDIEDALREHEQRKDFGDLFVQLARSVYRLNDRRSGIKRRINEVAGSSPSDIKSYTLY
ncbi:MAG: DUF6165 family protein [Rhizomicrobium sp.]|nr:DUF6165 family protein [Rhizomicrobium sp.]